LWFVIVNERAAPGEEREFCYEKEEEEGVKKGRGTLHGAMIRTDKEPLELAVKTEILIH
jgi:hypothetical protein